MLVSGSVEDQEIGLLAPASLSVLSFLVCVSAIWGLFAKSRQWQCLVLQSVILAAGAIWIAGALLCIVVSHFRGSFYLSGGISAAYCRYRVYLVRQVVAGKRSTPVGNFHWYALAVVLVLEAAVFVRFFVMMGGLDPFVVSSEAAVISTEPAAYSLEKPFKIESQEMVLCAVLVEGLSEQAELDELYEALLNDANLSAVVSTKSSRHYLFDGRMHSWSQNRLASEELSACLTPTEGVLLDLGEKINAVKLQSDKPLKIQGLFLVHQSIPGG